MNKELKVLMNLATAQGWQVQKTKGLHLMFQSPTGAKVFTPCTPGNGQRSMENTVALLRRAGMEIPRKGELSLKGRRRLAR